MIGKLSGIVNEIYENYIILDLSGVGYIVYITKKLLSNIEKTQKLTLYIEQHTYENVTKLYGFETREEQEVLKLLITVDGVNYKTAINLIDGVGLNNLISAIQHKDDKSLRVKGIGEKTAKKIIIQLSDDFLKLKINPQVNDKNNNNNNYIEAVSALINLGFDQKISRDVVNRIIDNNDNNENNEKMSINDIIVLALKEL